MSALTISTSEEARTIESSLSNTSFEGVKGVVKERRHLPAMLVLVDGNAFAWLEMDIEMIVCQARTRLSKAG
jgi:hypothetical protein